MGWMIIIFTKVEVIFFFPQAPKYIGFQGKFNVEDI